MDANWSRIKVILMYLYNDPDNNNREYYGRENFYKYQDERSPRQSQRKKYIFTGL